MKKKGFTLIELLVAILCASIVLLTVTSSVYFISRVTNQVVVDSANNIKLRTVRDYIVQNQIIDSESLKVEDKGVYHENKIISDVTNVKSIAITEAQQPENSTLYVCTISFTGASGLEELVFSYFI